MKKIIMILLFIFIPTTAYSAADDLLTDLIKEHGVYDNGGGIFYVSFENLTYEREFLLICRAENNTVVFDAYNDADGEQLLDSLEFPYSESDSFALSLVYYEETAHILRESDTKTSFYGFISGMFTSVPEIVYDDEIPLIRCSNGNLDTLTHSSRDIYNLLNDLKRDKIAAYPYMNTANTLDNTNKINEYLSCCANLTSFDIKNYDYDKIFKYVLYTHEDFAPLTDILPYSDTESQIKSVSGEYIDFIMNDILNIAPEHPPFTDLSERGFCYKDGMYLYTGGFTGEYSTEILDIEAAYDLGDGIYYIIFTDIYYEDGTETPEYSSAVINTSTSPFKLLRLGMGENLLNQTQISEYAKKDDLTTPAWEKDESAAKSDSSFPYIVGFAAMLFAAAVTTLVIIIRRRDI